MLTLVLWRVQSVAYNKQTATLNEQHEIYLGLLADLGRNALVTTEYGEFQNYTDKLIKIVSIESIFLTDDRYVVTVSSEHELIGHKLPLLKDDEHGHWGYRKIALESGEEVGKVYIKYSDELTLTAFRESLIQGIIIAAASMIVIAFAGILIGSMLVRRLEVLNNSARKISAGNLEIQADISGSDEVSRLAATFNVMSQKIRLSVESLEHSEKALARLNDQLQAKNKELEQVVYVASHDLRSPLVNIGGYGREVEYAIAELEKTLATDHASPEALKNAARLPVQEMCAALRYIRSSTTQMDALLTGLLKLSRSGRGALMIAPLDMNELVAGVVAASDFQVKEASIELQVGELPPCRGDAVQVRQVFANLLSNALKYLYPDRPGVIRINGNSEGGRSVYFVEDNGIGIAVEHQENIFEVFHRLEPSKGEGDGLGLTIVRQVIGRLEGEVRVESKPGEGSRFIVALPAVHGSDK